VSQNLNRKEKLTARKSITYHKNTFSTHQRTTSRSGPVNEKEESSAEKALTIQDSKTDKGEKEKKRWSTICQWCSRYLTQRD